VEFGLNFFPSVGPATKSAEQYFSESLRLASLADHLGYGHVRTVEHHLNSYGGYSPNPIVFLAAVAALTRRIRLVTGAVLPIFNNPLKLAGEIGMLDAISKGRLDMGFARAFLPHEFAAFDKKLDESRARFNEGIGQIRRLLTEEDVSSNGKFHSFQNVTSLPRPTQLPHPPMWIAAFASPDSFEQAGRNGYYVMGIPISGPKMAELMGIYREAWKSAGHPGDGRLMLSFAMHCQANSEAAIAVAEPALNAYLAALVGAASAWTDGVASADYPGYDKMIERLKEENFRSQREQDIVWVGSPGEITEMISEYQRKVGLFESASMQVNFHDLPHDHAAASMRLFAEKVMPHFR
jgi:alkanesulfonate monooxygenase SsuD/methylene tetrahydromethanopterin reductase-like flavin-dependent oxidoreductase (luciferase family)